MQVRNENQQHIAVKKSAPVMGAIAKKASYPQKRSTLVDLTNNDCKRARKAEGHAKKAAKVQSHVAKKYRTRSFFRKLSTRKTKKIKSAGDIVVFKDTANADADVQPDNTVSPVPRTQLPAGVRNLDDGNKPSQAYCYAAELHKYYFERECLFRPTMEAIYELQLDFTHQNRAMLLDWLIDVVQEFKLGTLTLFMTVNLIDRTLSLLLVPRNKLQLLGVACLNLAAKYTEDRGKTPLLEDLAEITDNAYTPRQIVRMEKKVLQVLNFELSLPNAFVFLARFLRCGPSNTEERVLAEYLSELFLLDLNRIKYKSSVVAAGALYLAKLLLQKRNGGEGPIWDANLEYHTNLKVAQVRECVQDIHRHHNKMQYMKLQAVYDKYNESDLAVNRKVVTIEPLAEMPFEPIAV